MRRVLIAALCVVAGLATLPALAHGSFVDARPLPGTTVGGTVDEVEFLFPEEVLVEDAVIAVTAPDGSSVPTDGDLMVPVDRVVRQPIEVLRTPGRYRVDYSIGSFDGFVFEGSFDFVYEPTAEPLEPLPFGRGDSTILVVAVGAFVVAVAGGALLARRRSRTEGRSPGR